jgi:hypothetical protein
VHKGDKGTLEETITDEDEEHPDLQSLPLFATTLQGTKNKNQKKAQGGDKEEEEETRTKSSDAAAAAVAITW